MRSDETGRVRRALDELVAETFAPLVCKDHRNKSGWYLQGLMLVGRVNQYTRWELASVWITSSFSSSSPPRSRPVERSRPSHPGPQSCGPGGLGDVVDRRPRAPAQTVPPPPGWPTSTPAPKARVGNVQIRVSVHAVTHAVSCPPDGRLVLPAQLGGGLGRG